MATPGLFIKVSLAAQQFFSQVGLIRNSFNLLASTIRAVFRTAVVAAFFLAIRSVFQVFNQIKTQVVALSQEFAKLNLAGLRTAVVLTKGGIDTKSVFNVVTDAARQLSTQVSYTAQEIQEGFYTAAQAGYNLEDSMKVATSAMKLAEVGGGEFGTTIDELIGVVNAFHVSMAEVPRIANLITGSIVESKMTLSDFFNSMKYVSAAAVATFDDSTETFMNTAAALMTMQDAGLDASKAGTYLRASLTKLQGGTSTAMQVFAKYGANVYEANGASQQYVKTLMSGQTALAKYYDKLNALKQIQFDLIIAGQQGSDQYGDVTDKINTLSSSISELEKGLDTVFEQFTTAGGKLKPLDELLKTLSATVPVEVIGKAFGIRGGMGLQVLLNNLNKFETHRKQLEEVDQLYDEGREILSDMFTRIMGGFLQKWLMLGNTIKSTFSVIFDAFLEPATKLLDPVLESFRDIFSYVTSNKNIFTALFGEIAKNVQPVINTFSTAIVRMFRMLGQITGQGTVEFPLWGMKEGKIAPTGVESVKGSAPMVEKLGAFIKSLISLFGAGLQAVFKGLEPTIKQLALMFVNLLIAQLKINFDLFIIIGKALGEEIWKTFKANEGNLIEMFTNLANTLLDVFERNKDRINAIFVAAGEVFAAAIWASLKNLLPTLAKQMLWNMTPMGVAENLSTMTGVVPAGGFRNLPGMANNTLDYLLSLIKIQRDTDKSNMQQAIIDQQKNLYNQQTFIATP